MENKFNIFILNSQFPLARKYFDWNFSLRRKYFDWMKYQYLCSLDVTGCSILQPPDPSSWITFYTEFSDILRTEAEEDAFLDVLEEPE